MNPWKALVFCMEPPNSDGALPHAAGVAFSVGISERADDIILRMRTPQAAMATAASAATATSAAPSKGSSRSNHKMDSSNVDASRVVVDSKKVDSKKKDAKPGTNRVQGVEFPPPGYRPTLVNKLLANALDLTAPASDALLKNRKNAWVQLAGHPGAFAPAGPHTIWKRRLTKENNETVAYQALMADTIREFVPRFYREVEYNEELFIEIEDLLQHFTDPSIMDIKMGTRTFLESEVKNPVLRKDLYEKMVKLNPNEPTAEEHENRAITKLRYMQFREQGSSTSTLGFRIEAIRMTGESPNTDLKKVRTREEVKKIIAKFLGGNKIVRDKTIRRLKDIQAHFEQSGFFKKHELIGSSLLIMHDKHNKANIWMIDFAKTLRVEGMTLNHRSPWVVGNHEDGYLQGLDNLYQIISDLDFPECSSGETESLSSSAPTEEKRKNLTPKWGRKKDVSHEETRSKPTKTLHFFSSKAPHLSIPKSPKLSHRSCLSGEADSDEGSSGKS